MNSNIITKNEKLCTLKEEKLGNALFGLAAGLNILGIEVEENEIINNKDNIGSKIIYLVVLLIAFKVYKDIFKRDIKEYNHAIANNEPLFSPQIKLIGNVFFVIGIILFIIAEITERTSFPPEI